MGSSIKIKLRLRPLMRPIVRWFMFYFYDTYCTIGSSGDLHIGRKVAAANTIFNLSSGSIYIGDYTIFGQNVMILTGRHNFINGCRAGLKEIIAGPSWGGGAEEVPETGYDIKIGTGCWVASGSIVIGGVTIGDNVIVAAGSVVTKNIPNNSIVAGVPAKIIGDTRHGVSQ